MTVFSTFSQFRTEFARDRLPYWANCGFGAGADFNDNNPLPDTVVRAVPGFLAQGIVAGMTLKLTGGWVNDGNHLIATVTDDTLTMDPSVELVNDVAVIGTYDCMLIDPDGQPAWPLSYVRAGGFDDTITFSSTSYPFTVNDPIIVTCNGQVADAVFGTADYNWYLSQRTDIPASQPFSVAQLPDAGGSSYSGTLIMYIASYWGVAPTDSIPVDMRQRIVKYCHMYCQRVSDGAIQWVDLSRLV